MVLALAKYFFLFIWFDSCVTNTLQLYNRIITGFMLIVRRTVKDTGTNAGSY